MTEIMPHLFIEREALQYQIFMHLHSIFRRIGRWSACKLSAFLIALAWSPGLQATPPSFERMAVYELYFFPHKNANFRIK